MTRRLYNAIERTGLNAVAAVLAKLNWIWREQPVDDFGIDGQIEIVRAGRPTGQLIGVQVKSGASYFKNADARTVPFYLNDEHWEYWKAHSLPVILVLHNPDTGITIWNWVTSETTRATGKGWRIDVPLRNVFDETVRTSLNELGPVVGAAVRRRRFALDIDLMRELKGRDVFVLFNIWINKSLSLRGVEMRLDDPDKKDADYTFEWMIPTSDIGRVLWLYFPWLEIHSYVRLEEYSGEMEEHVLLGRLGAAAMGFLELENYFETVTAPPSLPMPPESAWVDSANYFVEDDED